MDVIRETLKDKLMEAGNKFDGHVTHGSLEEKLKIIDEFIRSLRERSETKVD